MCERHGLLHGVRIRGPDQAGSEYERVRARPGGIPAWLDRADGLALTRRPVGGSRDKRHQPRRPPHGPPRNCAST